MPTLQTTITFFGVAVLLALAPGPDNIFVLLHSAANGRRAGALVVLGLCTGLVVHSVAVALGLAAVFAASAAAFTALKAIGAVYLVFLAWQAFRAPAGLKPAAGGQRANAMHSYARGVVMNLTNPKVVLFFLAFLPQFADPARGIIALQVLFFGGVFIAATLIVFGAIAYFSGTIGEILRRSVRTQRIMNCLAGLIFLGLASRLAFAHR